MTTTKTTVTTIEARHIDNSFYRLTAAQAKELAVDGELPAWGYEKRALPVDELNARFVRMHRARGYHDGRGEFVPGPWTAYDKPIHQQAQCWIKRTCIRWHDGKDVPHGWVWAIHVWEPA